MRPSRSAVRCIGVSRSRSKYPSVMSVTSALARDTPVTAKTMATGIWNAWKSLTPVAVATSDSAPTLTTKKNRG